MKNTKKPFNVLRKPLCFLILIAVVFGCQKEDDVEQLIEVQEKESSSKFIGYDTFVSRLSGISNFKTLSDYFRRDGAIFRNSDQDSGLVEVLTDSVLEHNEAGNISYTLMTYDQNIEDHIFKNVVVTEGENGVEAYLLTYLPNQNYTSHLNSGNPIPFEGTVRTEQLDLGAYNAGARLELSDCNGVNVYNKNLCLSGRHD